MPRKKFKRLLTFPEVMEESRCPKMVILELRNLPDTNDELPTKKVSLDLWKEMSTTMDEAKLRKVVNEMLRQRCTSGDEHQYHIDQMQNFLKNDIVDKYVKKFNPYARYNVEHWKNPHAKIFYIKKQKEPGKSKEAVYSNSKIVQIIKTYWELGHEHKFVTEIIARRENGSIVDDYAETGLLWSLSVFIRSIMIWERHGYVTPSDLSKEDTEYLQLFEEEIEERLKHRDQMRHWEILSKFEADFKQQQGEMTNKIDIVLKAITDRIMGALKCWNFTYVVDFMIVEDISSIIDPRLSQVVLGKPFVEISNMTHGLSLRVVKFTDGINEIAYKEDKRRGGEYVMSRILGFYKECLELGPEYLTGVADE
ncbi:hypothetical protein Tco_0739386 [Tanacetum coccineum]